MSEEEMVVLMHMLYKLYNEHESEVVRRNAKSLFSILTREEYEE